MMIYFFNEMNMESTKASKKGLLLDSDSSSEDDEQVEDRSKSNHKLVVNKKYASDFQRKKQQEELKRVRFEGGGDDSSTSSSSSEEEDEDGNLLTEKLDVHIFKTINALRSRSSCIYDKNSRFFKDEGDSSSDNDVGDGDNKIKKKKTKQKRYKDVVREQVLEQIEAEEKGNVAGTDDPDDEYNNNNKSNNPSRLAYDAEQEKLRKEFLKSVENNEEDGGEGEGAEEENWMTTKPSNSKNNSTNNTSRSDDDDDQQEGDELKEEMRKLEESLGRQRADPSSNSNIVDPRGEVKDGEKFLLDFFKNKSWVENDHYNDDDDDDDHLKRSAIKEKPATSAGGMYDDNDGDRDGVGSDTSLDQLNDADDFEARYNFRFEEAASGTTQSGADFSMINYAREGTNTVRRKDVSRREKRLARKERKASERKEKEEKLKRLKNAKRQEMEEKMRQVKAVLGDATEGHGGAADVDEAAIMKLLEGDFDPDKFENLMKETYGDDFYQKEDSGWRTDADVRECLKHDEDGDLLVGQDDADGGLYDNVEDEGEYEQSDQMHDGEEEEEEWPEDEEGEYEEEGQEETELEKKVKSRMMDELYKLDYEDIVAGQPTRFKYREVTPNNYGLSAEEILFARDSTLKQFASLKKMAPYREEGEYTVGSKKRRRFREMLKQDIEEQIDAEKPSESEQKVSTTSNDDGEAPKKKKRKKNRRLKKGKKNSGTLNETDETETDETEPGLKEAHDPGPRQSGVEGKKVEGEGKAAARQIAEADDGGEKLVDQQKKPAASAEPKKKRRKKRSKKKPLVQGVSQSRLASYGL